MSGGVTEKLILVIEDHPLVAEATRALLSKMDGALTISICNTAQTALAEFNKSSGWFRIFLDIDVPGAHGLSLARRFSQLGVANICTVITAFDNPQWRAEAASMGMLGYIVKATPIEDFTAAVEAVLAGRPSFPMASSEGRLAIRLTRRQQDVLCLLHRGYTSKNIALQLGLTKGTVDNHVAALLSALSAKSRGQAIAKGIELGYISFQDIAQPVNK